MTMRLVTIVAELGVLVFLGRPTAETEPQTAEG